MSYLKTYNEKMMPNGVINSDSLGNYTKPESGIPKSDLSEEVQETLNSVEQKQETLVSGENIKTINNESILGGGNIAITAQTYVIDNTPAADSDNLVKSGGVAREIVWDVTARNSNATFASLSALLSDANLATLIPTTIRRGGMQIRFVHSNDNKYVQYMYKVTDAATVATFTNVDNWEKMNLEEEVSQLGQEVDENIRNNQRYIIDGINSGFPDNFTIPSASALGGYYTNASADGGVGTFVEDSTNHHFIVPVSQYKGYKISLDRATQYGFIRDYAPGVSITYCSGCNRVTGKPTEQTIPDDCKYIYIYVATNTSSVTATIIGFPTTNLEDLDGQITTLDREVDSINSELNPIKDRLNNFYYLYKFNKTNTKAVLNTPIRLSQNGDSIQFKIVKVGDIDTVQNQQYSFSYGSNNSRIAIGLSANSVYVRAADGSTWIALSKQPTGGTTGKTIKISYESDVIKVYADSELLTTYNGQPAFELGCFGWNNTYGYWDGEISDIVVNGTPYILSEKSSTSTVTEILVGSILSAEEKAEIQPVMMFEKTSTIANIFYKTSKGTYIGIPLEYRNKSYTTGQYPSFLDNWGIGQMKEYENAGGAMVQKHTLFQSGEAELAVELPRGDGEDGTVYVGGAAHGFEDIIVTDGEREIIMLMNGVRVGESDIVNLSAINKFEVFQHTELFQAYTNTNPWAEVTKHWIFTKDGLEITSRMKILRALPLERSQFGMFCIYRHLDGDAQKDYLAGRAVRDDRQFQIFNIEDGWWSISPTPQIGNKDHDCTKISVWGDAGYGFSLGIENASLKANGGMFIGTNGGQAYNKIYFDLTGSYTPQVDEELYATQRWYFNENK